MKTLVYTVMLTAALAGPAHAQGGRDLRSTLEKLKELKDELDRAKEVYDYASGVAEDVRNRKEPRRPKTDKLKRIDDRLSQQLRFLRDLSVPPALDTKDPRFDTSAEMRKGDAGARRKAADKLLAFNKALRQQVTAMEAVEKELIEWAQRARITHQAGSRLANTLGDLYENPLVRAAFRDTFGMGWLELEGKILPTVSDMRSEAERKARDFRNEAQRRRQALASHTDSTKSLLMSWGLPIPSDLHD
jgi:hypothetical protein